MVFLDRVDELAGLEALLVTPSAKLGRLYGRRRLGKTALLREVIRRHGGVLVTIPEQTTAGILRHLSAEVGRQTGRPVRYGTVREFLRDLPRLGVRFAALDEFQRLRSADPGVEAVLQELWDGELQDTDLVLVLCGSVVGMMRRLTEATAPLYGRFRWDLHMPPFPYRGVRLFYPDADEEERVRRFSIFGATPHYHRVSFELPIDQAVRDLFLEPGAPLREEPRLLLELELRKPDRYQEIMEALGTGCRTVGEVAGRYGEPSSAYTPYVARLRDELGILRSDDPLYGKRRKSRIHFSDPFFHFYYRFVYPNLSRLELGDRDGVFQDIARNLEGHFGRPGFEEVARSTLQELNGGTWQGVRIVFNELGAWWDGEEELDVVAVGRDVAYAVEAKFTADGFGTPEAATLLRRAELFREASGRRSVVPIAISRRGFTPSVQRQIEAGELLGLDLSDVAAVHAHERTNS